jgi:plasmid maintenance system antidote protein VapI
LIEIVKGKKSISADSALRGQRCFGVEAQFWLNLQTEYDLRKIFNSALGELRGVIGIHIAAIAAQHGLDIEGDLATILPATDN